MFRIILVGGGWYGVHLALMLKGAGYDVEIFEKNDDLLKAVSGNFGIRLHKGPHYPRSPETRKTCKESYEKFCATYPELVVELDTSIYVLGRVDSEGNPSRVTKDDFSRVCHESPECEDLDFSKMGLNDTEIEYAANMAEHAMVLGARLRQYFKNKLEKTGVPYRCNSEITSIDRDGDISRIRVASGETFECDLVINTTGYQALVPSSLKAEFPISMDAVYQPCLALCYRDLEPDGKPFTFIVMDGWFPCLMPYVDQTPYQNTYIVTHGKYTIMGSCEEPKQAYEMLQGLSDEFIYENIKPKIEAEMCRFWPGFAGRFEYTGWKGSVLAKLRTSKEFRAAVTFQHGGVIYVFPGKVSNIFNAEEEVFALLKNQNCIETNGVRFVRGGVLDAARDEISERPKPGEPNTCGLDTLNDIRRESSTSPRKCKEFRVPSAFSALNFFAHKEQASTASEKSPATNTKVSTRRASAPPLPKPFSIKRSLPSPSPNGRKQGCMFIPLENQQLHYEGLQSIVSPSAFENAGIGIFSPCPDNVPGM